jgi:hypothetical protein
MADLSVDRSYLLKLAAQQDAAGEQAEVAAGDTSGTATNVAKTQGEYSSPSNRAVASATNSRQAAALALSQASYDLGVALRKALTAYTKTDEESGKALDTRMRDQ